MPLVVVEAMLCARACIATKVGGNAELICDGKNGFLAKAATVEFINEALNRAWENGGHIFDRSGKRAAADIRQAVPADPVGEFARELAALVDRSLVIKQPPKHRHQTVFQSQQILSRSCRQRHKHGAV